MEPTRPPTHVTERTKEQIAPPQTIQGDGDGFETIAHERPATNWQVGDIVGDYELLSELGRGGLGVVFLAQQKSLDRKVALKVSSVLCASHGEGIALAGLEHDNIVKVYAGFEDPDTQKHCLTLQYVPGTNLSAVIKRLHHAGTPPQSGEAILEAVDALSSGDRFDPSALRDREGLAADNFPQAVCRLGRQMAEALSYAHGRGVLHCDVKPGNILVTPYGRPMLVDFNVALDTSKAECSGRVAGGTLRYMPPEQAAVLMGTDPNARVDERSDVYSLGLVLLELATGSLDALQDSSRLREMPGEVAWIIRRCLESNPDDRYQSASALASALNGAHGILAAHRELPEANRFSRLVERHPIRSILILSFIPHVIGSILNITYNSVEIPLYGEQKRAFNIAVSAYNLLAYPACLYVMIRLLIRIRQGLNVLQRPGYSGGELADRVRRDSLSIGTVAIVLAIVGWLPGGLLFPLWIDLTTGGVPGRVYAHFAVSFILSGSVGLVYSYFGIQYVVLRGLYPFLANPDHYTPALAREELSDGTCWLKAFLVLATIVPLTGAVLLIALANDVMTLGFRLLVAGLIGLGMTGVAGLMRVHDRLVSLMTPWFESHHS